MKPRRIESIVASLAAAALLVPAAGGSPASVQTVQPLSAGVQPICTVPGDLEHDTRIAVNPRNPKNMAVSWFEIASGVTVVAISHDGGQTWDPQVVPGHAGCSGAEPESAVGDPGVTFDRDGVLYVGSLNHGLRFESVLVSRLRPGQTAWEGPEVVDRVAVPPENFPTAGVGGIFNHELWLAADPTRSGGVYAVWRRADNRCVPQPCSDPSREYRYWPLLVSRRIPDGNGEATWSTGTMVDPEQFVLSFSHTLRVLPNGSLLATYWECDARPSREGDPPGSCADPSRGSVRAVRCDERCTEGAGRWSTAVVAPEACAAAPSVDVARDGTAYAVWHTQDCKGEPRRILMSRSTDDGRTWGAATAIKADTTGLRLPNVAVGESGVIGVTYYDSRDAAAGAAAPATSVWLAHSHDGGASWEEVRLAGPLEANQPGSELFEYYGLAALPRGFAVSFVYGPPIALDPPQDIFFARVFVPGAGRGEKATGGGWLADRARGKINFGFAARETVFGFEGELQLNDNAAGAKAHLTEVTSLGPLGSACGSVQPGPSSLELLGSGTFNGAQASFRVCVQDGGEPGAGADRFLLACTVGCHYSTASRAADDAIDGGNIQVGAADEGSEPVPTTLILDPLLQTASPAGVVQAFTVAVYDQHQERLPNARVTLAARSAGGVLESLSAVTGAEGTAVFLTTTLADVIEYRATAGAGESNTIELSPLGS